jgi:hypothetical protein
MRRDGLGGLHQNTPSKVAHMVSIASHAAVSAVLKVGAANIPDWDLTAFLFGAYGTTGGEPIPFDQDQSDTCFAHSLSSGLYAAYARMGRTGLFLPSPEQIAAFTYALERPPPDLSGNIPILTDGGAELADAARAASMGIAPMKPPILGRFSDVPNQVQLPDGTLAAFPEPDEAGQQLAATKPALGPYSIPIDSNTLAVLDAAGVAGIPTWTGGPVGDGWQNLQPGAVAQPEPDGSGHAQLCAFRKTVDANGGINLATGVRISVAAPAGTRVRGILNSWGSWCSRGFGLASDNWVLSMWGLWPLAVKT